MFDYVRRELPLPGDLPSRVRSAALGEGGYCEFQTKDTPLQMMHTYVITRDGELLCEYWNWETKETEVSIVEDYDGSIDFYTSDNGNWYEFRASFSLGKLINIERLSHR